MFTSFYLGIAQGALARGAAYAVKTTRPWPFVPPNRQAASGAEESYIETGYGDLQSQLWGVEAQVDVVASRLSALLHIEPRESVTAAQRAHAAVRIAAAKIRAIDVGLEVTSRIFELTGARAVAGKYGFDVAWRDLRTHSLHDPVAHKRTEVGRYVLAGEKETGFPEPTWYT